MQQREYLVKLRDLNTQYHALSSEIDNAIARVIQSSCFIGGLEVNRLERSLAEYVGVKHCITCGNGTDALQLALMAWNIGPGDAVIVPNFTFVSSAEVVSASGATPVFVDVLEDSFNINGLQIDLAVETAINNGLNPKAIIAVDLFGLPANYSLIKKYCKKHRLLLLEDGAQGFGGTIEEQKACSFGDISTTSFFPAKPLGCYGDGGAVFTNNDKWATLIRSYATHGKGATKYDSSRIGINSRLDAIQAAILQVKLQAFSNHEINDVNIRAAWYTKALAKSPLMLPEVPENMTSSWAQYTVRVPEILDRNTLQTALKQQNIPSMIYYPKPLHKQEAFRNNCITIPGGYPITERLCRTVLSLPIGPYFSHKDCMLVLRAISNFLENRII